MSDKMFLKMNCATEYNPGLKKGQDSITLVMEGATIHGRWALSQVRSKYFILCYYISAPEQGETPLKSSEPQAPGLGMAVLLNSVEPGPPVSKVQVKVKLKMETVKNTCSHTQSMCICKI
jgi:pentose-5-phosphate-3-epimerase